MLKEVTYDLDIKEERAVLILILMEHAQREYL